MYYTIQTSFSQERHLNLLPRTAKKLNYIAWELKQKQFERQNNSPNPYIPYTVTPDLVGCCHQNINSAQDRNEKNQTIRKVQLFYFLMIRFYILKL